MDRNPFVNQVVCFREDPWHYDYSEAHRNPFVNQVVCFLGYSQATLAALIHRNPFVNQVVCFVSTWGKMEKEFSNRIAIPS